MPAAAIPIIMAATSAAGVGYGMYAQHKQQGMLEDQYAQARADQQGIEAKQLGMANKLTGAALPGASKALGYYSTLLNGSRGQMQTATAGPRGAINDTYRGAARGVSHSLTGGARDTALGELSRDRAGKVAGLTTGVQPAAAEGLGALSGGLLGQGGAQLGNAGMTGANLLSGAAGNWRESMGADSGMKGWGGLVASLMNQWGGRGGGTGGLLPAQMLAPKYGQMPNVGPSGNMGDN